MLLLDSVTRSVLYEALCMFTGDWIDLKCSRYERMHTAECSRRRASSSSESRRKLLDVSAASEVFLCDSRVKLC